MKGGVISALLSVKAEEVLPWIRNRGEAEVLLAVTIVGQQLDAFLRVHMTDIELEQFLCVLCDASLASRNMYDPALFPLLQQVIELTKLQSPHQMALIGRLMEHLCRLEVSIRQYGLQNVTLAQELHGHAFEVAEQKRALSKFELELCARINLVLGFAADEKLFDLDHMHSALNRSTAFFSESSGSAVNKRVKLQDNKEQEDAEVAVAVAVAVDEDVEEPCALGTVNSVLHGDPAITASENSQNSAS